MNRIQKYRRRTIRFSIILIVMGLVIFVTVMRFVKLGYYEAPMFLLIAVWLMLYVEYVNLKTKVEILTELEKQQQSSVAGRE